MQVQAITTQNNQTSFGAIFQPQSADLNKEQKLIADTIVNAMREPLQKFKGETAEGFYKSKGLDFGIAPRSNESVSLSAYKGMKEKGTGVDRRYTYSSSIYIGEYDKNSDFRVSDIDTGIKDKNLTDLGSIAVLLTAIATFLLIATMSYKQKIQETTKPLIEKIDSVANKAKAVLPDTTAVKTK